MSSPRKRLVTFIAGFVALACALVFAQSALGVSVPDKQITKQSVGVQMFMWPWASLSTECTSTLGPEGVDWILVSPPQEDVKGTQWWTHYQPVSYKLDSQLGTEGQFASMVSACNRAGVQVIVDAVINHMANSAGTGSAGSTFSKYNYPGLYGSTDFHSGLAPTNPNYCTGNITNYDDPTNATKCELGGLPDLATEKTNVRSTIAGYLNHLIALGVAGFRIDAAKHIGLTDLTVIRAQLNSMNGKAPYFLSEVVGNPFVNADYQALGDVFVWAYPAQLQSFFAGGQGFANFLKYRTPALDTPANSILMVSNHDTEHHGGSLTYNDGKRFLLAHIFALADDAGKPMLYSSYAFNPLFDGSGPAANSAGNVLPASCPKNSSGPLIKYTDGKFVCLERWTAIKGMIQWHHEVADAPITGVGERGGAFWFSRGTGFVAINTSTKAAKLTVKTNLPAGRYCDVITGGAAAIKPTDGCRGTLVNVLANHSATVSIPAAGALALDSSNRTR